MTFISKKKIFLVDDHPLILEGMSQLINQENKLEVVGTAEDVDTAIQKIRELQPDLVIVDIALKGISGLNLITQIKENFPKIYTLVMSMYEENVYAERALQLGAKGYLTKDRSTEDIVNAIHKILEGKIYFSPEIMEQMVLKLSSNTLQQPPANPIALLSSRELEIFHMLGNGFKSKQIAGVLHLSSKTVDCHCANIKQKLKLQSASELMHFATIWLYTNKK